MYQIVAEKSESGPQYCCSDGTVWATVPSISLPISGLAGSEAECAETYGRDYVDVLYTWMHI